MNTDIYILVEQLKDQIADITHVMLAAAKELAGQTGGKVSAVLLGYDVRHLTQYLAVDRVLLVDQIDLEKYSPDTYLQALSALIQNDPPGLFLMGHTSIGMDLICGLGARLNLPIVSQCQRIFMEEDKLKFSSQICGGKIRAQGELPMPAVLISMVPGGYKIEHGKSEQTPDVEELEFPALQDVRIKTLNFIEPDETDVDISKQSILVAVGRGLQNQTDLELVKEFTQAVGGTVVASRPIIDQGWLPSTRLVGKSGKSVAPKLYLALGISGAPEHVEGIQDCELVVAVNTDPTAPIFDFAQYGIEEDMIDVLTALTEHLKETI